MPIEYRPPKYAQIVNALQQRITDGTYASGVMLPSETALMAEFDVSRPVVVRALEILRQDGWIESQQGKGRFARSRPVGRRSVPEHAASLLMDEAEGHVEILHVATAPAPPYAATALGLPEGSPVVVRYRRVSVEGVGPVELSTAYIPEDLADGTDVGSSKPLSRGLVQHLAVSKALQFGHATERISARPSTPEEQQLLGIGRNDWLLTVLFCVFTREGLPAFALDVAVPPTRHEFEDSFPLT
ncbi:GntR family transcriptional regulator [Dactylosporangium sp. NPDC051541]|uniref:GntR family transcriptional regulator n=1 Tax=Dactylosporangium sp. NPDC051541 TaxID=3363977 RepID=UPI0037A54440